MFEFSYQVCLCLYIARGLLHSKDPIVGGPHSSCRKGPAGLSCLREGEEAGSPPSCLRAGFSPSCLRAGFKKRCEGRLVALERCEGRLVAKERNFLF